MFYTYKNGEKAQLCKECTVMHINIWQPDTFVWLLEKYDVPWIPGEWNSLREKAYAKNPQKKNDTTVFGKYLSKMKLKQWKQFGWADTQRLQKQYQEKDEQKAAEARSIQQTVQQQYEKGQISQAQYRTLVSANIQKQHEAPRSSGPDYYDPVGYDNMYNEKDFMPEQEIPDLAKDLTEEDKKYLVLKWGRLYKPQEWIELETFYKEMTDSFDIQDADTRSTLILICKNNLKMNQALDTGDLEGYQKLARVSDTLRKSAKFTAAQNKQEKNDFVDSVGELVEYCEKNGGAIPTFDISQKQDIVDIVIQDLKEYTRSLIYQDTALARQIEDYLKKREHVEQRKQDLAEAKAKGLGNIEITDQDISEYNQSIEKQKRQDIDFINGSEGNNDEFIEPIESN